MVIRKKSIDYIFTYFKKYTLNKILTFTETGSAMTSTCVGLGNDMSPPSGVAGRPVPGYNG